jgi:hypothetical protein
VFLEPTAGVFRQRPLLREGPGVAFAPGDDADPGLHARAREDAVTDLHDVADGADAVERAMGLARRQRPAAHPAASASSWQRVRTAARNAFRRPPSMIETCPCP